MDERKRSSWWNNDYGYGNDDDDHDDGEIEESVATTTTNNRSTTSGKRLRPTITTAASAAAIRSTTVTAAETHDDHYYYPSSTAVVPTYNSLSETIVVNVNKMSREELERERQIRMAALRRSIGDTDETFNISGNKLDSLSLARTTASNKKSNNRNQSSNEMDGRDGRMTSTNEPNTAGKEADNEEDAVDEDKDEDNDTKMMEELFGIRSFGSTKNTKVVTNHTSAAVGTVAKHLKPRKYRQYMNRKNGFNRPLDNV